MQALQTTACCLEAELGAPPVSPLSVVSAECKHAPQHLQLACLVLQVKSYGLLAPCQQPPTKLHQSLMRREGVCCPPNLVVCPEANPLRDGSVLLGLLGQFPLDEESLLGRLQSRSTTISHTLHNDLSRLQLHTARDGRQENHKGHKAH